MFVQVFEEYQESFLENGDLSVLPTRVFLSPLQIGEEVGIEIETGKTLFVKLLAVTPLNAATGTRDVYFELNGEARTVPVRDVSVGLWFHPRSPLLAQTTAID